LRDARFLLTFARFFTFYPEKCPYLCTVNPKNLMQMKNIFQKIKKKTVLCALLVLPLTATAQTITGLVVGIDGEPVIGATVLEKGTTNGTATDIDGKFKLTISSSSVVLTFSCLGCKTEEKEVKSGDNIHIVLLENAQLIGEVIVTGYTTQRKADCTACGSAGSGGMI